MPLYDFICECGHTEERFIDINAPNPTCPDCHKETTKQIGSNIMIKMKGEGGYPSRRRQVFNTTKTNHPPLEKAKNPTQFVMSVKGDK